MKRIIANYSIAALVCLGLVCSCGKPEVGGGGDEASISLSGSMGCSGRWERGDAIGLFNGNMSEQIGTARLESGEGGRNATFSYSKGIADGTSIYLVYPAGASERVSTNQTQTKSGICDFSRNTYAFAKTTVISGKAAFTLSHAPSFAKLSIASETSKEWSINKLSFSCEGVPIAGDFSLDMGTNTSTAGPVDGATNFDSIEVTLSNPATLSLSPEIFVALIPCNLSGKDIILTATLSKGSETRTITRTVKGLDFKPNTVGVINTTDDDDVLSENIEGTIKDTAGVPFVNAVVSDGYSVVRTDDKGYWKMGRNSKARFVFCTLPADAKVECDKVYGIPCNHYKVLSTSVSTYNFTFTRQAVETKFRLLALGDPQIHHGGLGGNYRDEIYKAKAVPDIRNFVASLGSSVPTYALTVGDNIQSETEDGKVSYEDAVTKMYPIIATCFGQMNVPVYATIGNHDYQYGCATDAESRAHYEDVFGPVCYSLDRGDVHIIIFDNVLRTGSGAGDDYKFGWEDDQQKWILKDLSMVPVSKRVIVAVHIPFGTRAFEHKVEFMTKLATFKSALILSGHGHDISNNLDNRNYAKVIEENEVGSTGAPWKGDFLADGCPRGYKVYEFNGTEITADYYKSIGYDKTHQMRMYRTSDFPAFKPGSYEYAFPRKGEDWIAVNIYNDKFDATAKWSYELYEDGIITSTNPEHVSTYDLWIKHYFWNNYKMASNSGQNKHTIFFQLTNAKASKVKVVAKDRYGTAYSVEEFTKDIPKK